MNAILSIIMCIAMVFGGADVPAVPETATAWTLSNLTLEVNGEGVTLNPEFRLTGAIGSSNATLSFEATAGDKTLLPLAGQIDADGVRFSMGNSGNAYTLSADMISEMMGMDEEDQQIIDSLVDVVSSAVALFSLDELDEASANAVAEAFLASSGDYTTVEDFTMQLGGESYKGQTIDMELTWNSLPTIVDALADCGIAEFTNYVDSLLAFMNLATGTNYTSFTETYADLAAQGAAIDMTLPMTISAAGDENNNYIAMAMGMNMEGIAMDCKMVQMVTNGEGTIDMSMNMSGEGMDMGCTAKGTFTGPADDPTAMDMTMNMTSTQESHYEWDSEDKDGTPVSHTGSNTTTMNLDYVISETNENGLRSMDMQVDGLTTVVGLTDGQPDYTAETPISMHIFGADSAEDDGSVTTACGMEIEADGELIGISFDLNQAEVPYADPFAGKTAMELTPEMIEEGDSSNPTLIALSADAMSLASDAMMLAADPSVTELISMFNTPVAAEMVTTEVTTPEEASLGIIGGADGPTSIIVGERADDNAGYIVSLDKNGKAAVQSAEEFIQNASTDIALDEYGYATVDSIEEAASVFTGNIPTFTAPEGYVLEGIEVSADSCTLEYASEDNYFGVSTYSYDMEGASYYSLQDGALAPSAGMVEMTSYDGVSIDGATVFTANGSVYFYFGYDFTPADVEAVLAGLSL